MSGIRGDRRLLSRAAWSVSIQIAVAVALVVVLVSLGSVVLFDRQQAGAITGLVRQSATTADDVTDPPDGVWLLRLAGTSRTASPGTPDEVVAATTMGSIRPGPLTLSNASLRWPAWVSDHKGARFVAVYDESRHRAEEHRLLVSTGLAGLVGVLLAALIGFLVGRRAVRPLGQALELQRRFVADASHELRTPLAVLHTRAQMLRRHLGPQVAAPQREEVDQLVADTAALGEVVADLLLSAQLHHTDVAAADVDVLELVEQVAQSLQPYAALSGIRLTPAAHDHGWSAQQGPVVSGAPTALRRALTALVDNAIAHSQADDVVVLHVDADDHTVSITVQDEGDGIDQAAVSGLTQRFARGTTSSGGGRRFGLGLALVDEVVRAHRGDLVISGRPGEGSSFTMRLPREHRTAGS
jgi:signal transduction histidine kinase